MTIDLGRTNSIDVLAERATLAGRSIADVGCGGMAFSRLLAERGAQVLAFEPDRDQAARHRDAEPIPGVRFVEAGADRLPAADSSLDGVVFSFSLHHVPGHLHEAAIAESVRVLRPDGFLCVVEPADGPLNTVMKFFHDEDAERAAAQATLRRYAVPAFEHAATYRYHSEIVYDSFDAFASRVIGHAVDLDESDPRRAEAAAAFQRLGGPEHRFESPKVMMLLEGPRRPSSHATDA